MKLKIKSYNLNKSNFNSVERLEKMIYEVKEVIASIEEEEIINEHENYNGRTKSISKPLSNLITERLKNADWIQEVKVFKSNEKVYLNSRWSLDFLKDDVSVEIAFNHEEGTAWNIIKGFIAFSPHSIRKSMSTIGSIIITATNDLKKVGGFDSSVGSFEKYEDYMRVFEELFEFPVVLIGIEGPDTFFVKHNNVVNKKLAKIEKRG